MNTCTVQSVQVEIGLGHDYDELDDQPGGCALQRRGAPGLAGAGRAAYVQQAAADGETVTLTAKRRMMTPEQVADAMGVSRPTISRKIKAGEIRAVKVGNRNRIPYEEFERYWRKTMGDLVELTRDELRDDLFGDQ